ncbi:MAG: adenylyl cyclase class-3/4/guanylyl cyclase, partial [Mycobacterium sp.]|nr:adenylyl cyclase class-3/4/guanylyl cyclase [Mycobacterium sp.]
AMTVCPACATPAAPSARFCGACGSALPVGCPTCGAATSAGQAFCTDCGTALAPGARRGTAAGGERRRGEERRIVSVVFVDVVGWTNAAEQLDPEDLRAAQSDYFAAVRAVIEETGGTLEKYIGDAVLACYGAPRATEDDALRAVRAALLIQDALAELVVGDAPLAARIGVATSEALVDLDADPARGQAFVTGDVVNLASRLQSAAPSGGVLVSRATRDATADSVEFEAIGELSLKGKADPVEGFLAHALSAKAPSGPRHDLPFVGRGPQFRLLESCLDRVIGDGAGALVTITGEPGIGKSRLVHELRKARSGAHGAVSGKASDVATNIGVRWLSASCVSFDNKGSFAPLAALISSWSAITDATPPALAADQLGEQLTQLLPRVDTQRIVDALSPLLGHAGPAGGLDGRSGAAGAAAAWRRIMVALAEESPTVIVLEDLQRADEALLDAVEELLALATEVPLLLIVTSWPELFERRPGWGSSGPDVVTLNLPPLDETETVQLLSGLLGSDLPSAALSRLVALAGGNPMYAEQCAGMLRDREAAQLVRGIPELPLPRSVQGLVSSRLDLVSDDERAVLHAASVLGDSCWPGPAALLAEMPGPEVEVCLAQLTRRGMLRRVRPSSVPGEPEYVFRSALVRELVYARLPRQRRLKQHVRAADWWSTRTSGREAERAELVAHHRVIASELASALRAPEASLRAEQARLALREAAERSYVLRALLPTRDHLERALALWPETVDPVGRQSCLRLSEEVRFLADRDTFVKDGGPARVAAVAAALSALGADAEAARAHTLLGQVAWWVADRTEALTQHGRAVELLASHPAGEQQALALTELARLQMLCEHTTEAIATGRTAVALAERMGLPEAIANSLCTVGVARYVAGDPGGIADQEAALELSRREQLAALPRVANNLATTLQEEGELRRSYALMDEAATSDGTGGAGMHSFQAEPEAALRAYNEGDWDLALSLADGFLDVANGKAGPWEAQLRGLRAMLRLLRGEPAESLMPSLEAAIDQAHASGFPQIIRPVLAIAARCAVLEGNGQQAQVRYDELLANCPGQEETPSREWLPPAVAVACFLDAEQSRQMGQMAVPRGDALAARLRAAAHRTRWVSAALASLKSASAAAHGDPTQALEAAEEAVTLYGEIGDETERGLAVALAAERERELRGSGRWEWELAAFATRTGAIRLVSTATAASEVLGLIPEGRQTPAQTPTTPVD